jgi:integrase
MHDTTALMARLMYGTGIRHRECRTLRIKDICFDQRHIVVRNGKAGRDRVTLLPDSLVEELQRRIGRVTLLHQEDLRIGLGKRKGVRTQTPDLSPGNFAVCKPPVNSAPVYAYGVASGH